MSFYRRASGSRQTTENRNIGKRVPSHHVRELAMGKFIIKSQDIVLLENIEEGVSKVVVTE